MGRGIKERNSRVYWGAKCCCICVEQELSPTMSGNNSTEAASCQMGVGLGHHQARELTSFQV